MESTRMSTPFLNSTFLVHQLLNHKLIGDTK